MAHAWPVTSSGTPCPMTWKNPAVRQISSSSAPAARGSAEMSTTGTCANPDSLREPGRWPAGRELAASRRGLEGALGEADHVAVDSGRDGMIWVAGGAEGDEQRDEVIGGGMGVGHARRPRTPGGQLVH